MNIGIIIGRIGGVDGVALETEKWVEVLHRMGHSIYILSGRFEERFQEGHAEIARLVPPEHRTCDERLYFFHPDILLEQERCFASESLNESRARDLLEKNVTAISSRIRDWLEEKSIDLVISQNASALPMHLSLGVAIYDVFSKRTLPLITHDHDFWWERGDRYYTPYQSVRDRLEQAFPLCLQHSQHAVINSAAAQHLADVYNRDTVIIPNVMDFNVEFGHKHEQNASFRQDLGFSESDILLLQITRVVRRKGIATALELIERLDDSKVHLLISGSHTDDPAGEYHQELLKIIAEKKIAARVHFVPDRVQNKSYTRADGSKVYALSDAYAHGTAACYFSTYEGFGNAFVECIAARKPIFVNNYKPVYWSEIGSRGFKTVQIEDSVLDDKAVEEIKEILYNPALQKEIAEHNFALGKQYFSYEVLQEKLTDLLSLI